MDEKRYRLSHWTLLHPSTLAFNMRVLVIGYIHSLDLELQLLTFLQCVWILRLSHCSSPCPGWSWCYRPDSLAKERRPVSCRRKCVLLLVIELQQLICLMTIPSRPPCWWSWQACSCWMGSYHQRSGCRDRVRGRVLWFGKSFQRTLSGSQGRRPRTPS